MIYVLSNNDLLTLKQWPTYSQTLTYSLSNIDLRSLKLWPMYSQTMTYVLSNNDIRTLKHWPTYSQTLTYVLSNFIVCFGFYLNMNLQLCFIAGHKLLISVIYTSCVYYTLRQVETLRMVLAVLGTDVKLNCKSLTKHDWRRKLFLSGHDSPRFTSLTALGANSSAALTVQLGGMTLNSATVSVVVKLLQISCI